MNTWKGVIAAIDSAMCSVNMVIINLNMHGLLRVHSPTIPSAYTNIVVYH